MEHRKFAHIYDDFTKYVDYNNWYKFLATYFKQKKKILDIGSGTGTLTNIFYENSYDITGLDISKDMIDVAKKKNENIKYYHKDITNEDIDINEKFAYIMCNFDTVNYFKGYDKFKNFVKNVSKLQNSKDILIFDIVTEEIFDEIFEDNIFIDEDENYLAIWQYEKINDLEHKIDIDIFYNNKNGFYERFYESHTKYIFDIYKINDILNEYGYSIYDTAKNSEYGESRIFIIAKKENNE